jgi:hypothetical protein
MNTKRILNLTCFCLLLVALTSACALESLSEQQITPSSSPNQSVITESPNPLSTQVFSVIETPKEVIMTSPMPQPLPQNPGEAELVRLAMKDLAGRLNTSQESIQFVHFEAVVWPDGSLGCPQPGLEYLQVQSEGYRIQLRFGNDLYEYHGGGNRPPFLCETESSQ